MIHLGCDEQRGRRSGRAARGLRRRRHVGRRRRGHAAARARDARRLHQPHRHRRAHARWRHRLAHQDGRPVVRQPGRRRGGDRRRAHRSCIADGERRPVLGAARRRRQLRRRHVVRVRAAPGGPDGPSRPVLLRPRPTAPRHCGLRATTSRRCQRSATVFLAIGLSAPPAPFVPEEHRGRIGHALLVAGFGSAEAASAPPWRRSAKPSRRCSSW